ncbi:alpha/beta hydrolase [Membranihabitans marinus]|uniref:alpha/beta hydrolase n=1 Tax=Membranihabitans marinus TaxID=1227546 RepID=UPI001F26C710|nr:alpha/beta fold hydrolase [Membranihabitans marinus]
MEKTKIILFSLVFIALFISCGTVKDLSIEEYYKYDSQLPLNATIADRKSDSDMKTYDITFESVHQQTVTATLTMPNEEVNKPWPVIIFMHGLGDHKEADYMEYGNQFFIDHQYAVLRVDIANHGDRETKDFDFSLTDGYRYWTRDVMSQTVFDLQRAVDFIESQANLDSDRIGYFGISLGGMIGTIFSAIEKRIKVPVITLAGGKMHFMFGAKGLTPAVKAYFSVIDPINFVADISPRPLLMVNASNDEIVPPITSKFLYKKAKQPKEIIWYPNKHRDVPPDLIFGDGVEWFKKYL